MDLLFRLQQHDYFNRFSYRPGPNSGANTVTIEGINIIIIGVSGWPDLKYSAISTEHSQLSAVYWRQASVFFIFFNNIRKGRVSVLLQNCIIEEHSIKIGLTQSVKASVSRGKGQ